MAQTNIQYVRILHRMNGSDCLCFSMKQRAWEQFKKTLIPLRAEDCILADGSSPKPWQQLRCSTCNHQITEPKELYSK